MPDRGQLRTQRVAQSQVDRAFDIGDRKKAFALGARDVVDLDIDRVLERLDATEHALDNAGCGPGDVGVARLRRHVDVRPLVGFCLQRLDKLLEPVVTLAFELSRRRHRDQTSEPRLY